MHGFLHTLPLRSCVAHDTHVRHFARLQDFIESVGGIANRPEILAAGFTPDRIRFAVQFGTVQRLCRGWYGSRRLPRVIRDAWRSGGPLACVSALEFMGLIETVPDEPLHVCRRTRGHRLRNANTAVIHWSDEALRSGSRFTVSAATAAEQALTCSRAPRRPADLQELALYLRTLDDEAT